MAMESYLALDLLLGAINDKDCAIHSPSKYINHVFSVMNAGYQVAFELERKDLPINASALLKSSKFLLHDLGRANKKSEEYNTDIHEFYTGEMLRAAGFPDEANILQRHFVAYEKARDILVPRGFNANPEDYIQNSLESKILTFADSIIEGDGSRSEWRAKLEGLPRKYKESKRADPLIYNILTKGGLDRVYKINEEIEGYLKR